MFDTMKKIVLLLIFSFLTTQLLLAQFKTEQKQYSRVKTAYTEKEAQLKTLAKEKGMESLANKMIIVAYKEEKILQVWLKSSKQTSYNLFKEYDFCSFSGELGPKRKMGDGQIPEGFYYISNYNPYSNFYLSLGINYPNASDRILSDKSSPGSDIYIHGACVTIGCIPITDDKIKEVYVLAVEAKNAGQTQVPVYIFPAKLTEDKFAQLKSDYKSNSSLIDFWTNLKVGYDKFSETKKEVSFTVDKTGKYIFK